MAAWALRRLALAVASLWVVATATFLLLHAIPGDPFASGLVGLSTDSLLRHRDGLDLPLGRQYLAFLAGLMRGRLGTSLVNPQQSVRGLLAQGLGVSALLGAEALCWALGGGLLLGLYWAYHPRGAGAVMALVLSLVGLAVPNFVLALVLDWLVGVHFRLLPVAGWGSFQDSILPSLTLGMAALAVVARLIRAGAAPLRRSGWVRTARAAGLTEWQILWRHVLRNAALPVLTALGPMAAGLITGSLAIEQVFALPGLGALYVQSILDRDYPVVLGLTIFYASLLVAFNLLVDLGYALLDPRLRPWRDAA